jgi:hypothetical protein
VSQNATLADLAKDHSIAVTQVVTDGPEGDVTYHFVVRDGEPAFGAGAAHDEDVRMVQTWSVAVSVATGEVNAQDMFINGSIRIHGDVQKLIGAEALFAALDTVFESVRPQTTYA